MKIYHWFVLFFIIHALPLQAQSISSSPYSIYGLGSLYESDFGPIPAMGSAGLALPSSTFINNKNPASLAFMSRNSFFFDIGLKRIESTYTDGAEKEKRNNSQFSHIAIAFPINTKSGVSIALQPYSSAAYTISDYKLPIAESNNEFYNLNANSKGGLNNLNVSYGYKVHPAMTLGLSSAVYFGSIEDDRYYTISNSTTLINQNNYYSGIRFTLGNQTRIDSTLNLGITLKMPTKINASKTQTVQTINNNETETIEDGKSADGTNYYLPFEIGVGFSKTLKQTITVSFDYEKSFWNSTNQSNLYVEFNNQDKFSLGFAYHKNKRSIYFADRLHYFSGLYYDTGFLSVSNSRVNTMALTVGVGIPLDFTGSFLNISYSYGIKGRVATDLIRENYHKIGVNFSFEGFWFAKRKID